MSFYNDVKDKIEEGKNNFAEITKTLVYKSSPQVFDLLDFYDDDIFLEPLLFTYFNSKSIKMPLLQILYGYIKDELKPQSIDLKIDEDGIIYLPNVGYFIFNEKDKKVKLQYTAQNNEYNFRLGDASLDFQFKEILTIPETEIEICQFDNPLLKDLFKENNNQQYDIDINSTLSSHQKALIKAFQILEKNYPLYYELITSVVKKVVMYKSDLQRSFASITANGTAFFRVKDEHDEVAILEDITHQCGHVIFYAMAIDKEKYFKVDVNSELKQFTGNQDDYRSVLGAFYALFPYCGSNMCSNLCFDNQVFTAEKQAHEFIGRFAFRMEKFKTDMQNFNNTAIFTEAGWELYQSFKVIFDEIYDVKEGLLKSYDISGQPYEFDYDIFCKLNPLEETIVSN